MWCWAASGEMIMEFLGATAISQCAEASQYLGISGCCQNQIPDACINGGWPQFWYYGFHARNTDDAALSWEQLTTEIDANRPVAFSWHWNSGGGHMMVAIGYKEVRGQRFVVIHDPWPPQIGSGSQLIPHDVYQTPPDGTHWRDFYAIERTVSGQAADAGQAMQLHHRESVIASRTAALDAIGLIQSPRRPGGPGTEAQSNITASIPVIHVGLNELNAPGALAVTSLMTRSIRKVVHLVSTPDGRQTSIVTQSTADVPGAGTWKPTSIDNSGLAKLIAQVQPSLASNERVPNNVAILEAPALGLFFLVRTGGVVNTFASMIDDPSIGLVKGQEKTEADVWKLMVSLASRHNKQPS